MRLKKLEIYGFKSFAEKVEIVFDDGITGIVGPNGSGKSNINDAVRWVLGEQSAKMLRGAKMEDVIFNGTEKRKRLSYCEVTLTFDNSDGGLAVDFAEVAVTRRVYRNGEGEYFINRAACRLKDILEMFRDTGIGRDGYSLIGQGRIDEVLSNRGEDRREIFEEAAGIVKYRTRRKEAEHRLENTRANLARVDDILTELEGRLEPLRLQSETAREYLAVREELKGLEINVFLLRSTRYEQRIAELKESAETLASALEEAEARHAALNAQREKAQALLEEYEQITAGLREQVQELIRDTEAKSGAVDVLRERLSAAEKNRDRLEKLTETSEGSRESLETELDSLRAEVRSGDDGMAGLRAETEEAENRLAEAEAAVTKLEADAEEAKAALIAAMNRLSDMRSDKSRYTTMLENAAARKKTLSGMIEAEEARAVEQRGDLEKAQTLLKEEEDKLQEERKRTADIADRVRELNEKSEKLTLQVSGIQAKRRDAQARLKILYEMRRDYEGYQNAVRQVLLRAKKMQGYTGVRGAVAEILRVPEQYERAIDMALGASLQNIVVSTEEDAKQMIAYLRETRSGRATFLPLTSVRGRTLDVRERQLLSMPGCFGVASELVDYDGEYAEIVKFLLGRTVIAKDLDAGIPIMRAGHQAFRLVTLEGDVMNSGGSMTGGSVQSRMTSLLTREREIEEHEKYLKDSEEELNSAASVLQANEDERARLKQQRTGMFDTVHKQEIACERQRMQADAAKDAVAAREARIADLKGEMDEQTSLEEDIGKRLANIENAQEDQQNSQSLSQSEIARMQKELLQARSGVSALREQVNAKKVDLAGRESSLNAKRADIRRLENDIADLEQSREDNKKALEDTESAITEMQSELTGKESELGAARDALKTQRTLFEDQDGKRASAQKQLAELSDKSEALRAETTDLADKKSRTEVSQTRVEGEYKQMCDRIWEEYELTYAGAEQFRVEDFKLGEADRRIAQIKARIREMGTVNVASVDEYRETSQRVTELTAQRDDLTKADEDLQKVIEDLTKHMARRFTEQFRLLGENFKETFVKLFGGGQASLELSDPADPLNCDIEIKAQPPGKKLTLLSLLSGGERTLTAIAIVFAMLKLKPTPFCFLDEIEAALDDANIDNFAEYLREFSRSTQFVVVTHRKGTMERCDSLYGVAMEEKGVTRMVSVRLSDIAEANA